MSPILPPVLDLLLGHVSQASALLVYCFTDPLRLQAVGLASALSSDLFYLLQRPPVLIFFFWTSLQACICTAQCVKLSLDVAPVSFSERELLALSLTQRCFDAIPSRKIARVLRRCGASWVTVAPGETVATLEHGECGRLYFVVEGGVDAINGDGRVVFRAHPGSFVGETSLSHAVAGTTPCRVSWDVADVAVARADEAEGATCLAWPVDRLARALRSDAELLDAFREAVAIDLYAKMEREESVARSSPTPLVALASSRREPAASTNPLRRLFPGLRRSPPPPSPPSTPPPATTSQRLMRKDSMEAVVDFVRGTRAERGTLYRAAVSPRTYAAVEAPYAGEASPRERAGSDAAGETAARTTRPAAERARERRACLALRARQLALGVAGAGLVASLAVQGIGELLGNGSQVLITGAFAVSDPLLLNVVALTGAVMQTAFFWFRDVRLWSSIIWSAAQVPINLGAIVYLALERYRNAAPARPFSDRELFAARVIQRAGGLDMAPQHLAELLVGGAALAPAWAALAPGEPLPSHRVGLLCDGAALVTRPEDGSARRVRRGALLNGDQLAQHLDAIPPADGPTRRRSFSPTPLDSAAAFAELATTEAAAPCEVLTWDLAELVAFLATRRDARLCANALISSMKLAAYMSLDKPPPSSADAERGRASRSFFAPIRDAL